MLVDEGNVVTLASLEFAVPVLTDSRGVGENNPGAERQLQKGVGFEEPEEFG